MRRKSFLRDLLLVIFMPDMKRTSRNFLTHQSLYLKTKTRRIAYSAELSNGRLIVE